ncbi:MAG: DUF4101 domain-containing protein [Oscillatoria sp. SIO1A7]|nr:DUF4101 domain-containing protein [Oscillatoria sp. SIO1A7]
MRIPLDYYRILGLPIQATAEQLQQAHRDRKQQLPRREYSEVATLARKQLIDEAYAVLSDVEERKAYDVSFLARSYEQDSPLKIKKEEKSDDSSLDQNTPTIEIEPEQFIGALLVLQELGEYELVLKLALPVLGSSNISLKNGRFGDPKLVVPDIVLTVALACLELGREQWQQNQYENAATSLETGQDLLLRQELFPNVRGEIRAELDKLRPYRILELLALPEAKAKERRRGLQFLQDMLQERGGIDGNQDDRSGLSVDDFLRFIQQLRGHLTALEQQEFFETEARRPSAVATYLAVYALVARGFAEREPSLIRRAKLLLTQLGRRQDVHLEQAVCCLLLGQTVEASAALELTQERQQLEFIRQNSQEAPDLLPGLCLYGERWLQSEVFPYFRDLASAEASLKDYFADEQVQAYLESLPESSADAGSQWMVMPQSSPRAIAVGLSPPRTPRDSAVATSSQLYQARVTPESSPARASSLASDAVRPARTSFGAERSPEVTPTSLQPIVDGERVSGRRSEDRSKLPVASRVRPASREENSSPRRSSKRSSPKGKRLKLYRLILVGAVALMGLLLFFWLTRATLALLSGLFSGPALKGEQLNISLNEPLVTIPDPGSSEVVASGAIDEAIASTIIEDWFSIKKQALGSEHQIELLEQILIDPALSKLQTLAKNAQKDNWYWDDFRHTLQVGELLPSETNPNQATVEVKVNEAAKLYEAGKLALSKNDNLLIRYDLVRQDGQWRISNWEILK